MIRVFLLSLIISSSLHAEEIKICEDREVIERGIMNAPRVTELREGSVLVSAVVGLDGHVESINILSQEGDFRWGKSAEDAMKKTIFEPASTACMYEYNYIAKFENPDNDH